LSTYCYFIQQGKETIMSSKKIVVFGATGTIGKAVVVALSPKYEVVQVSNRQGEYKADLADAGSVRNVLEAIGKVDGIISAAGAARFAPLEKLSDEDFSFSIANKLMGQVNLTRIGMDYLNDKGSITLTSGILSHKPMVGSAAISLVNAGLEGFARAAALEAPRGIRVNVVSPPWVTETLKALNMDPSQGKPVVEVAQGYVKSLQGQQSGDVIEA
jgi:NAD(P)-dependent dehydrogenase (short-subunit alcohol dehydrogenase family)